MTKPADQRLSIYVASDFLPEVRSEFEAAFDIVYAAGDVEPLVELAERSQTGEMFDGVLFSLDVQMRAEQVEALPDSVRFLATYSVGTDHVDQEAAETRDIAVFNTPGVLADSVAEDALFLMLGAARRATESIELIRSGRWKGWTPTQLVGVQLAGRRLGILGMGDIGRRIASRAEALGMQILHCNRRPPAAEDPLAAGYRGSAVELIRDCDVLMLVCPSTEETRGIVNAELLGEASAEMIVVNIARGDLVNDDDLIGALRDGRIRAAGLDVFAGEPEIDPRYFELPNVFMLPHIGSSTIEARLGMGRILINGVRKWQAGGQAGNRVV